MATIEQLTAALSAKDEEIASLTAALEASQKLVSALRDDLQSAKNAAKQKRRNPIARLYESSDDEPAVPPQAKKRFYPTSPGRTVSDDLGPKPWKFSDEETVLDNEPTPGKPPRRRSQIKWTLVDK